jgi:sulfatase modifying factor 1
LTVEIAMQRQPNIVMILTDDHAAQTPPTRAEPTAPAAGVARVMRGGSYLCHDSYCNRYRNSALSSNTANSSMGNAGFRTVAL